MNYNYKTSCIFRRFELPFFSIGWQLVVVQSSGKKCCTWD